MPSEYDVFAEQFAAPALVEQFADRDGQGNLATISYYPTPLDKVAFQWPAIVLETRFEEAFDADAERMKRREILEVVVERRIMADDGVTEFERRARVEVRGRTYVLDKTTTKFSAALVTLGLIATPLEEISGRRDAI